MTPKLRDALDAFEVDPTPETLNAAMTACAQETVKNLLSSQMAARVKQLARVRSAVLYTVAIGAAFDQRLEESRQMKCRHKLEQKVPRDVLAEFLVVVARATEFPTFGNIDRLRVLLRDAPRGTGPWLLNCSEVADFLRQRKYDVHMYSAVMEFPFRFAP